jgi:hypothetical protein
VQEAPRGGPGESGAAGDVAEGQLPVVAVERADHRQPPLERLHERRAPHAPVDVLEPHPTLPGGRLT